MTSHASPAPGHRSLKERARHEFVRFLAMFLYLWLIFSLFQIHEYLVLAKLHAPYYKLGAAFVNALVFAKVMLLADNLRVGDWIAARTLAFTILFRALALAILFIVVHVIESGLEAWFRGESLFDQPESHGGVLAVAANAALLAVSLVPFLAFEEIELVLGPGTLRGLLLTPRPRAR